jgi:TRAP-type C4-dicarboxylate transport system permease small subunit
MSEILLKFKKQLILALNILLIITVSLLVFSVVWGVLTRSLGALVVWLIQNKAWQPWPLLPTGQASWTEELARFLLVWVALIGGAVAFGTKGHLGVDYFVGKFHHETRKLLAVFAHLCVLFFSAAIFIYGGSIIVHDSLAVEQMTPALGWKMGYVYMALPIAGIFMVLFTIENLIETIITPASNLNEAAPAEEIE